MDDQTFEPLVFETSEQIRERFRSEREESKPEKVKTIKEPEVPRLTPIWEAYWTIDTSTPEKFEAWLRLRPPQENIYLTKESDAKKTVQFSFQGFKRASR